MQKDALLNEIVIGQKYGYADNKNGINEVAIGTALKTTETRVTLQIIARYSSAYDSELREVTNQSKEKAVAVKGCRLFPVA